MQATFRYDLLAFFQIVQEGLMLFCLLLLWSDQQKVKDHKNKNKRDK